MSKNTCSSSNDDSIVGLGGDPIVEGHASEGTVTVNVSGKTIEVPASVAKAAARVTPLFADKQH